MLHYLHTTQRRRCTATPLEVRRQTCCYMSQPFYDIMSIYKRELLFFFFFFKVLWTLKISRLYCMKHECLLLDHDIRSTAIYVRGLPEGSCSNSIQEIVAERSLFTNDVLYKRKRSVKIVSTLQRPTCNVHWDRERERDKNISQLPN
jgi:hypothetical protein